MKYIYYLFIVVFLSLTACTDLKETLREDLAETESPDPAALLQGAYEAMRLPYQDQSRFWAAQQHTSDETIGPTRGPDWDDNGIWRTLHNHTWDSDHAFLGDTFGELLQIVFATSNLLQYEPSAPQAAEARFIRAFVLNSVLDGWGQVPFREEGTSLLDDAIVLSAQETIDLILAEVDAIINDLPNGPTNRANADAAKVLKMKTLLNKGAYLNRQAPTFDANDMNAVITLADEIIESGKYSVATNYFDNFAWDNDMKSTENIWTAENIGGSNSGNVRSRWMCTLHYNQNPSGWNGFTTLGDFYTSFEEDDLRKKQDYLGMTDVAGINAGFLAGQQQGYLRTANGDADSLDTDGNRIIVDLMDRKGNPLAFTKEVSLTENGDNLEITGVRVVKYPIDYASGDNADNDYVYYRFSDVWLMKAEALLRTGDAGQALDMVNTLRSARGASDLASLTEGALLAERGRELYWEGHRRTDLIRFGKFLDAWEQKPASGSERLLFPIPAASLASNPNLQQNPGY